MKARTLSLTDLDYPRRLRGADHPPRLRVRGHVPQARAVAVVGTRQPSPDAVTLARALAGAIVERGFTVWSGGAYGVDTAAHRGAIDAGGQTVVVLGGGLNHPSPSKNLDLFHDIVATGGGWLSQFADDVRPAQHQFLMRNAVLAASVELLLVVECPLKSGARNAALHARKAGTPVAALPHSPWNTAGAGCNQEIRDGAFAVTSQADLVALLDLLPAPSLDVLPPTEPISTFASRLLAGLDHPRHADELAIELSAPAAEVLAALVELRLAGHVVKCPDGRVARRERGA